MKTTPDKLDKITKMAQRCASPLPWETDITRANEKIFELWKALVAYQGANRMHNDAEAALYDQALEALAKAESWEVP